MRAASLAVAVLLTACGPSGFEQHLGDYQARLGRTLELEPIETGDLPPPRLPRTSELTLSIDSGSQINLLDFLSLDDCGLQTLVAHNNSPLGRVATASGRLVYDLEFLALAVPCLAVLAENQSDELATALAGAIEHKQANLGKRAWNAIIAGPEWRDFWKRSPRVMDPLSTDLGEPVQSINRLQQLTTRWLSGDYSVDRTELEGLLETLRHHGAGDLMQHLQRQDHILRALDASIAQQDQPVCWSPEDPKGQVLGNVVRKFFVGTIQVRSAVLNRELLQLEASISALETTLASFETAAYQTWRQQRDLWLASAAKAPRNHVDALLPIMEQCGVRPKA